MEKKTRHQIITDYAYAGATVACVYLIARYGARVGAKSVTKQFATKMLNTKVTITLPEGYEIVKIVK